MKAYPDDDRHVAMNKLVPYSPTSPLTKCFLVLLRLAIGWHLFIEGASKLETFATGPTGTGKPFSSKGYLLQSQGPLGPYFRKLAGDPDQYLLTLIDSKQGLPAALETQWRDYVSRYSKHYNLDAAQQQKADVLLQQHLTKLKAWFDTGSKEVSREYSFASTTPTMTTAARIAEYQKKLQELRDRIDGWNLRFEKDVTKAKVASLRGEVAKLRTELQKDLDDQQEKLGIELDKLLTKEQLDSDISKFTNRIVKASQGQGYTVDQQAVAELVQAARDLKKTNVPPSAMLRKTDELILLEYSQDPEYYKTLQRVSKRQVAPPLRVEDTNMLDMADHTVAWGLTIFGLGLLLGCFTRFSATGGACLLLLFYLALPPLPGLPDNPMAEGKYLFVNKNLIEALALITLATTASGRWLGLDGLISLFPPFKYLWPKQRYVNVES